MLKQLPNSSLQHLDSYRPISLLGCLSKLMERLINDRVSCYLETSGLLHPVLQAGFRQGCSGAE